MKSKSGFTLVETLVVMVVIAIIGSVITFTYINQQVEGRAEKRIMDIDAISSELDLYYQKNGNYPITCGFPATIPNLANCPTVTNLYNTQGLNQPNTITPTSSNEQIKTFLPGLGTDLRDPRAPDKSPPINRLDGNKIALWSYFVISSDLINTEGTLQFSNPDGTAATCKYKAAGPTGNLNPHQYIVGLYNETTKNWMFAISPAHADTLPVTWSANSGSASDQPCNNVLKISELFS